MESGRRCGNRISQFLSHEIFVNFLEGSSSDRDFGVRRTFKRTGTGNQDDVYDYGFYLLDNILKDNDSLGKGLSKYPKMPGLRRDWHSLLQHENQDRGCSWKKWA